MTSVTEIKPIYLKEHEDHQNFADSAVLFIKNNTGEIKVKVCNLCGYEDVECLHIKNNIFDKNPRIVCRLCGG